MIAVLILASGHSSRFIDSAKSVESGGLSADHSSIPGSTTSSSAKSGSKILAPIEGQPALVWLLQNLAIAYCAGSIGPRLVVAAHPSIQSDLERLVARHARIFDSRVITGGQTRQESAKIALCELEAMGGADYVMIHDGARPLATPDLLHRLGKAAARITRTQPDQKCAIVPAVPMTDLLRSAPFLPHDGSEQIVQASPSAQLSNRPSGLVQIQTPQWFPFPAILDLHRTTTCKDSPDDATLFEDAGLGVHIIPGERSNLKLTYLQDLAIAGALIRTSHCATPPLLRVGHGYDLHPIQDGGMLILCATQLDCGFSLKGHSDADVALHALCDAILGAISAGDIGDHFPPDEARWKDCGSSHFVRHAIGLAANRGYRLANCDITMITEKPKIAPLRQNMQHAVANLLDVQPDMVSIKATTNEKLGAIGRMEAIAALATVTLVA